MKRDFAQVKTVKLKNKRIPTYPIFIIQPRRTDVLRKISYKVTIMFRMPNFICIPILNIR